MSPYRKAFKIMTARLALAGVLDETGGDHAANADIATAEARLHDWLSRRPEPVKQALREYFGAEHTP